MCGICGIIGTNPVDENRLAAMSHSLASRGPDDSGTHVDGFVGLAHRRLSIIDLSGGHQPLANEDESIWITFNGEIYNYQELRSELIQQGHRFRTQGDTETILHLYEQYGPECVKRLRGMFAFSIWDGPKQRLFAARDHLGQKPFFYALRGNEFLFGSEIKSLLAADTTLRRLDLAALDQYLTLRIIAPPRTMFREVSKLPPAHYLIYDKRGGLIIQRYWNLSYIPKLPGTDQELAEELEHRILDALKVHLVSDVPVGAYLSGGLDSSLVVAMVRAHGLTGDLQTFSGAVPYKQFDEAPSARLVAKRYRTIHHEVLVKPSLLQTLPKLIWHLDEPSDPLAVCQYMISEAASRHVKVVLGGDGGDELFGGYDRYYGNLYVDQYTRLPAFIRRGLIGPALTLVPDGRWYKSLAHQLKWIHHLSFYQGGSRYAHGLGYFYFRTSMRREIYGPVMRRAVDDFDPHALIRESYECAIADNPVDCMLYADSCVRLPDHPVMILDRMTMAHGLEARAPFMDHRLAEFCATLPIHMKIRGRTTRHIQRILARKYLPPELLDRPKQGFQSALNYMLKDELRVLYCRFLDRARLARDGLLQQATINRMLRAHTAGHADHGNRLWLLLNSEAWYRSSILGESIEELCVEPAGKRGSDALAASSDVRAGIAR